MTSNFKYKLLSQLVKKREEGGFTLIELMVVVVIIGVLAAIAVPNLVGQVGKARNTEGQNGVAALNSAQQIYRTGNNTFGNLDDLDTTVTDSDFFTFTSANGEATGSASSLAAASDSAANQTADQSGTVTFAAGAFTVQTSW
jgi:type IV pilus assembly protein PilA